MKAAAKEMDSMTVKSVADTDTDFMDEMLSVMEDHDHELQGFFDRETDHKHQTAELTV